jgi:hypothetical protein
VIGDGERVRGLRGARSPALHPVWPPLSLLANAGNYSSSEMLLHETGSKSCGEKESKELGVRS